MTTSLPTAAPASGRRHGATVPVVAGLHVLGFAGLVAAVAAGGGALTLTTGLTAYALGLRHAFDADHIAAIDNTTRRLVRTRRDARGVGLYFSLGHSTVVLVLAVLIALGVRAASGATDDGSAMQRFAGVWGPTVSGVFLLAIAAVNVVLLVRAVRGGAPGGAGGAAHHGGGPVAWLTRRLGWAVDRPSRMYAVGLLFGLGFDTATEVGLLAMTSAAALGAAQWTAVLPLPVLFAAGMSALDSAQGAMARRAYAWGGAASSRTKVRYDVVVTGVSAASAAGIGLVQLVQVTAEHVPSLAGLPGAHVPLEPYGLVLTGVLLVAWGAGLLALRQSRHQA